jgi:hypothetical protein
MRISYNPEQCGTSSPHPAILYNCTPAHWKMDETAPEKFYMRWLRELNPDFPIVSL